MSDHLILSYWGLWVKQIKFGLWIFKWNGGTGTDLWSLVISCRTWSNDMDLCAGGLGWLLGKGFSPGGWMETETGSPGQWEQPQAWQSSGSVWTTFSGTGRDCWGVLCRVRSWTWCSLVVISSLRVVSDLGFVLLKPNPGLGSCSCTDPQCQAGHMSLQRAVPCAHLAPHGSTILGALCKWVGKNPCQRGMGTVAAVQRKASGHLAFLLGAGSDFFVLWTCSLLWNRIAQIIQTQSWGLCHAASWPGGWMWIQCGFRVHRQLGQRNHSSWCCWFWCDVEKDKVSARRGESELGKTQGKIWEKCEALAVP